jgi:hypothetical protein
MRTHLLTALILSTGLPGCTAREGYGAAQNWQRTECNRMVEPERSNCLARAKDDYDTYEKKRKGTY